MSLIKAFQLHESEPTPSPSLMDVESNEHKKMLIRRKLFASPVASISNSISSREFENETGSVVASSADVDAYDRLTEVESEDAPPHT